MQSLLNLCKIKMGECFSHTKELTMLLKRYWMLMEICYYLHNLQSIWPLLSTDGSLLKQKKLSIMIGINVILLSHITVTNAGTTGFWENLKMEWDQLVKELLPGSILRMWSLILANQLLFPNQNSRDLMWNCQIIFGLKMTFIL